MIVDSDAHFTPKLEGEITKSIWYEQFLLRVNRFSNPDDRHKEMREKLFVDRQLLNPTARSLGLTYSLEDKIALQVMQAYNAAMCQMCDKYSYYDYNIWLALQNPEQCIDEIKIHKDKCFAAYANDIVYWGFADNMKTVWQTLEYYKMPLYLHFSGETYNPHEQIPEEFLQFANSIDKSKKWLLSIASLLLSDMLTEFPNLKIIVAERNIDWIPYLRELFLCHGFDDPLSLLKTNFWFTIEPESINFLENAQTIGYNKLLFATDWPHNDPGACNAQHDVATVNKLNISVEQKNMIFYKNYIDLQNKVN